MQNGHKKWYFEDMEAKVEQMKKGYVVLNAMRWMSKEDWSGHYTYQALLHVDIMKEFKVFARQIKEFCVDVGINFVEKWKGHACENFKK